MTEATSNPDPVYDRHGISVHHDSALSALSRLPDCSVDAVITDPPYGLGDHKPAAVITALTAWANGDREHVPDGKGFMGRDWDAFVPPPAVWDECLRVLKPGGHLAVFAGTRTVGLMDLSIRLAGFEIRDGLGVGGWVYGSGFPKSLDVSRAIDQMNGRDLPMRFALARHIRERRQALGISRSVVADRFPQYREVTANWERTDANGNRVPTRSDWAVLAPWLGLSDDWLNLVERVEADRVDRAVVDGRMSGSLSGQVREVVHAGTPVLVGAHRWQGWGTALKPAWEPIILARKPLSGTVAATVLAHGTGAVNIDACRTEHTSSADRDASRVPMGQIVGSNNNRETAGRRGDVFDPAPGGRWPTNVLLTHHPDCGPDDDPRPCVSDCHVAELDRQSGTLTSGANPIRRGSDKFRDAYGEFRGQTECTPARGADSGGASRFFPSFRWEAKAPTSERPQVDGVAHPTVKPVALMRWLVRLLTSPGGLVLDPFAGSGTTGQAARAEGMRAVLIEREADYIPLIKARLDARERTPATSTGVVSGDEPMDLLDLLKDEAS